MPSTLIQFFTEHFSQSESKQPWSRLMKDLVVNHSCDEKAFQEIVSEIENRPLDSFAAYLSSWRQTLTLFLAGRISGPLPIDHLVEKLKGHRYFRRFQLARIFESLVEGSPFHMKQLPQGGVLLETNRQLEELSIPKPQLTAELGVLALIQGLILKDKELLSDVIRFARFHMQTLDARGKPFAGLWTDVKHFSYASSYAMNYLLFSSAAHLSPWPKFHLLAETQISLLQELEEDRWQDIAAYVTLLAMVLDKELEGEIDDIIDHECDLDGDQSIGFSTFHGPSLQIACTTSGVRSGVGSISKGPVRIVSMGPCFHPIGEPHTFGVHRVPPLSDTIVRKNDGEFSFNGWTRLVHPEKGHLSKSWMELQVQGERNRGRVTVRFSEMVEDLHFAFFVESKEAIVNENFYLQPASLDRYSGESAEVLFQMGDHTLKLLSKGDSGMQVIPLAGGDHFWGANFLVAFSMPLESAPVQWEII